MKPSLHVPSHIPLDPQDRVDWADTQIAFSEVISSIMGCDEELRRLAYRAWEVRTEAKDELIVQRRKT